MDSSLKNIAQHSIIHSLNIYNSFSLIFSYIYNFQAKLSKNNSKTVGNKIEGTEWDAASGCPVEAVENTGGKTKASWGAPIEQVEDP